MTAVQSGAEWPIGISGWPFREWPLHRTLRVLQGLGVSLFDYWPPLDEELEPPRVKERCASSGISLYCFNVAARPRLGEDAPYDEIRAAVVGGMEQALRLQIPHVQFYGSGSISQPSQLSALRRAEWILEPVIERAEREGLTLWFENDYDDKGVDPAGTAINRSPESVAALIAFFDSPSLRVTFDLCNFLIAGEEGFPLGYDLLRPYVVNVHVKDARRFDPALHRDLPAGRLLTSDVLHGTFVPVPAGSGACNLAGLLHRLHQDGFEGYVTLDALCRAADAPLFFPNDLAFVKEHLGPRGRQVISTQSSS